MSHSIQKLAVAVGLALASAALWADESRYSGNGEYDFARVIDVQPLRRQVRVSEPVRECWQETTYEPDGPFSRNHIGGTLVGSALGTVVGNQIGRGSGKDVARVAGAILGGAIGLNVSRDRQRDYYGNEGRVQERCDVRQRDRWEERTDGYRVTYEYAGREYVTQMPYDPGQQIRVRVDVTPTSS